MATRYVNIDRDTALLLPPDLRDWVPEDHLVHFVIDAVDQLDVSSARANERGTGSDQYLLNYAQRCRKAVLPRGHGLRQGRYLWNDGSRFFDGNSDE